MEIPNPGRIVNFVMKDGTTRGLLVTKVFPADRCVNGAIFVDGEFDGENMPGGTIPMHTGGTGAPSIPIVHRTSVCYAQPTYNAPDSDVLIPELAGTWHWPVRK